MRYDQYKIAGDIYLNGYVECRRCGKTDDVDRLNYAMLWAEEHELICDGDDAN